MQSRRPARSLASPFSADVKEAYMNGWEYKVMYVDFRGRISADGVEFIRQSGEHRTGFVRRYLETLGKDGWEMTGIVPLVRPESSYFIMKRPATAGAKSEG
jgi:hypothetical protein